MIGNHVGRGHGDGTGTFLAAGATGEYVGTSFLRCVGGDCDVPSPYVQGTVFGRIGYDWSSFGLQGGAVFLWQRGGGLPIPELTLRFGPIDDARFLVGFGSYDLPTASHPGLWAGTLLPLGGGWQLAMHLGVHLNVGDGSAGRAEASLRMPLDRGLWLGLEQAVWANDLGWGPETAVSLGGRL